MSVSLRFILFLEPPDPVGGSCLEMEASRKACESLLSASLRGFISCSRSHLEGVCACVRAYVSVHLCIVFKGVCQDLVLKLLLSFNSFFFFFKLEEFFKWLLQESSNPGMTKSLEEFGLCKGNLFVFGMNHPVTDFCS